jgi:two-component system sensor histidine kinase ChiS
MQREAWSRFRRGHPAIVALVALVVLVTACADSAAPPTEVGPTPTVVRPTPVSRPVPVRRPPPSLRFERIGTEDGLSSSIVTCIQQDSLGYIWFGTQDGLNRYDGYSFTVYRHDPDDPGSPRDDFIESIYLDRSGVLWVGTQDGWLERYDRETDQFTHHQVSSHVFAITEGTDSALWLGTRLPGLVRFDPGTAESTLVYPGGDITSVIADRDGVIWFTNPEAGLARYDPATGRATIYESAHQAHTVVENGEGELLVGTWGSGVGWFDRATGEFSYQGHDPGDSESLSHDYVSAIYPDQPGVLWIGTIEAGLNRCEVREAAGAFELVCVSYQHDPGDLVSLSTNYVTSILKDESGVLWVGGDFGGGINKVPAGAERFGHYRHTPDNPNGLSEGIVTSMAEDQEGVLWIGTFSGLDRWDGETGRWRNYRHDSDDPASLADNAVRSVYVDQENVLWVGSEGGLDRYDREADQFVHVDSPVVMWMHEGPSGTFWLATKDGLFRLDRDAEQLQFIMEGYAWKIMVLEDRSGLVWVGSSGDGLACYNPSTGAWRHYENDPDDPTSLSNNSVEAIHEDAAGDLWVGTRHGLNQFHPETETFTQYRVRDGLPHDAVVGILEDGQGRLWLATGGGLSRFDQRSGEFKNHDVRDGLQANEYWRNSYHQSASGEILFGGVDGLNAFFPEQIVDNPHVPPIHITQFSIFNEPAHTSLSSNGKVELSHEDNFLSFEFVALDYSNPAKNQYAYWMENVDEEWVYAGARRHADYVDLRPGRYVFRVKGANNDGVWNEEGAFLRITIEPPFWGTWWFRGGAVLVLVGIAGASYRWRLHSVEARSRELERQVEQEIGQRMKVEEALRASEMEAAVVAERTRLARELHDAVTQTLFSASLIAEALPASWERDAGAGRRLLEELRQLSRGALAEMRTLLLELRPVALVEAELGDLLRQLAEAAAGREGLPVEVTVACECDLPTDVHIALYRIAQEAMNNVVKHARAARAEIRLACSACAATGDSRPVGPRQITLSVRDDGRGFDPARVPPDRLGLSIMRERAEGIGAQLEVASQPDEGTEISVVWREEG